MDFYTDFTSEIRKVARGSMTVADGFVTHEDQRKQKKILELIHLFNSGNQAQVRTYKSVSGRS
jgi:large exoprotein involved in heme utilization and adhesion